MPLAYFFWIVMFLWVIFGFVAHMEPMKPYAPWGHWVLPFLAIVILGYHAFGAVVK